MPSSHAGTSWGLFTLIVFYTYSSHAKPERSLTRVVAAAVLLVPISASRVILFDHSFDQVFWGAGVGLVSAGLVFVALDLYKLQVEQMGLRAGLMNDYYSSSKDRSILPE